MKSVYTLVCAVFLFLQVVYAQPNISCGTIEPSHTDLYPPSTQTSFTVRLALHIINRDNGTGGLTSAQVTSAINKLKLDFSRVNIFFVVSIIDSINNTTCYDYIYPYNFDNLYQLKPNLNAINIYPIWEGDVLPTKA